MYKLSKIAAGSVIMAAAALGGAGVALADGYRGKKIVYERPADWSGFYFGLHSGWQFSSIDYTSVVFPGFGFDYGIDHDSGIVGGHIGLQHQFGAIVLGIEANLDSTIRDKPGVTQNAIQGCPVAFFFVAECTGRLNDILSVGGRLGFAAGHWMPYATGGYASARFNHTGQTIVGDVTVEELGTRHSGWYVGAGFEWIVSPGWTAGLEYRHYEFDNVRGTPHTTLAPQGVPIPLDEQNVSASVDSITARVSWRFGRPEPRPLK